jgi:hypothetical protein
VDFYTIIAELEIVKSFQKEYLNNSNNDNLPI